MRALARGTSIALALLAFVLSAAPAAAASLDGFFGSYVGVAEVKDASGEVVEQRDMDIVISPFRRGGFRVRWVNVTLVDGRRDVPGVQRRIAEVVFEPRDGTGFFTEGHIVDPFTSREEIAPLAGDPVRWAKLDDDGLHVFSFVVLPDGAYELHTYTRQLTDIGLDLFFERVVDGVMVRRIEGHTVRAD